MRWSSKEEESLFKKKVHWSIKWFIFLQRFFIISISSHKFDSIFIPQNDIKPHFTSHLSFMYLSNQNFYTTYLSHLPAREIFPYFEIIDQLLLHYGPHKLQSKAILPLIKKSSPTLFQLLSLLISYKKLTKSSVKTLKSLINFQDKSPTEHFIITSPSKTTNSAIAKAIKQHTTSVIIDQQQTETIGLHLQGNNGSYERTLEKDLQKIFQNLAI